MKVEEFLNTPEAKLLADQHWRLNHLYQVINKEGLSVKFKLNPVQEEVYKNLHRRNLILKARQLGMSTFSVLYLLDCAAWNCNLSCGIVSYSRDHAEYIFKRVISHALETLPDWAKPLVEIEQSSARSITFSNGSVIRVDTTLRGSSYQIVLVSEFGKTCARNPLKAEEVVTGTLQTVPKKGTVIIESTGEGNSGYYADLVNQAVERGNENLTDLEYKLFFFPWYKETQYVEKTPVTYGVELTDYFDKIEISEKIRIIQQQRYWYALQRNILGDKLKQEFPSTIAEAFVTSSDAYYFQNGLQKAYNENRCLFASLYDPIEPVYVAMDIGVNDLTVMVFFQVVHGEIRFIDYYSNNGQGVEHYCRHLLQEKNYLYKTVFLPHDAARRDGLIVENTYEREFKKFFSHTQTSICVLKRTDKNINISNAKIKLERAVFNLNRTKPLVDMLNKYRKKWSEQYGKYLDEPLHDISSNYADAFIYACQAINQIEGIDSTQGALQKHRDIVASRRTVIK